MSTYVAKLSKGAQKVGNDMYVSLVDFETFDGRRFICSDGISPESAYRGLLYKVKNVLVVLRLKLHPACYFDTPTLLKFIEDYERLEMTLTLGAVPRLSDYALLVEVSKKATDAFLEFAGLKLVVLPFEY